MTLARSPVPRLDGQVPRKPSFSEYLPHKQEEVAMTGGGRINIVQQLLSRSIHYDGGYLLAADEAPKKRIVSTLPLNGS